MYRPPLLSTSKVISMQSKKLWGHTYAPLPKESQIPLSGVYHNRPQICYNLASQILHDIYLGNSGKCSICLPMRSWRKKYGVSVSTLRRTIAMLSQAGACRTINGKGTRIFTLGSPAIHRILIAPQYGGIWHFSFSPLRF